MVVPVSHYYVAVHVGADSTGEGQLTVTGALRTEFAQKATRTGQDLHAVIVRVGNDDLIVLADCRVQRIVELIRLCAARSDPL